jgi:serine/threonine-protein kinase RsbW
VKDHVTIRIPPATAFVGLVRALASGLGARLDFTYDQIMDLHIAIDEVCSRLLATTDDPAALSVAFAVDDGRLSFDARAEGLPRPDREFLNPLSQMILEALVDRFEIVRDDDGYVVQVQVQRTGA